MKTKTTILSIVAIFGLLTAATPKHSEAATMPLVIWVENGNNVIVSVVDLGMVGPAELEACVWASWPSLSHIGIMFRLYYPWDKQFSMSMVADGYWVMFGLYGEWWGSGCTYWALRSDGWYWTGTITTSPPSTVVGASNDALLQ